MEANSCLPDVHTAPASGAHHLWSWVSRAGRVGKWGPQNVPRFTGIDSLPPMLLSLTDASCQDMTYARFLPGYPKTSVASTGLGCIILPEPARSWPASAGSRIPQDAGKGCYKAFLNHYCCYRKRKTIQYKVEVREFVIPGNAISSFSFCTPSSNFPGLHTTVWLRDAFPTPRACPRRRGMYGGLIFLSFQL